jgi:hypothetical protein
MSKCLSFSNIHERDAGNLVQLHSIVLWEKLFSVDVFVGNNAMDTTCFANYLAMAVTIGIWVWGNV